MICSTTTTAVAAARGHGHVRTTGGGGNTNSHVRPSTSHHLLSLSPCVGTDKNKGGFLQGAWSSGQQGEGVVAGGGVAPGPGLGQGLEAGGLESMDEEDEAGMDVDRALLFVYGLVRYMLMGGCAVSNCLFVCLFVCFVSDNFVYICIVVVTGRGCGSRRSESLREGQDAVADLSGTYSAVQGMGWKGWDGI